VIIVAKREKIQLSEKFMPTWMNTLATSINNFNHDGGNMKCFVHLGFDPLPKQVDSPAKAINLAEAVLKAESEEEPDSKMFIQWRRDEFYPNNFHEYNIEILQKELSSKGSVVLQLVDINNELPSLGRSITIFTEEVEKKYAEEAENALEEAEDGMEIKALDLHGESFLRRRTHYKKK
jgi:hypothetical protein